MSFGLHKRGQKFRVWTCIHAVCLRKCSKAARRPRLSVCVGCERERAFAAQDAYSLYKKQTRVQKVWGVLASQSHKQSLAQAGGAPERQSQRA